jgi:Carboxypeptidase regulatory-like domain
MWSMSRAGMISWAAILLAGAGEAAAQNSVVRGRVLDDSTGNAVAGVQVQLLSADKRVLHTTQSLEDGAFAFAVRRRGEYRVRAATDGFREVVTPRLAVGRADSLGMELRLRQGVVRLPELQVIAQPRPRSTPGLDDFRFRLQSSANGRFITREQVQRRDPGRLTDMLTQSGVRVTGNTLYLRRVQCPPLIFMDGVQVTRGSRRMPGGLTPYDLVNLVTPLDVEGIEIYSGLSSVPAQFGGQGAECGVIAIWTRRSERKG